jgi:hypothetical protein
MASQRPLSDEDRRAALGDVTPVPTHPREPDPSTDRLAADGVQPADRHRGGVHPTGGR